jgi:hypothetical protein
MKIVLVVQKPWIQGLWRQRAKKVMEMGPGSLELELGIGEILGTLKL